MTCNLDTILAFLASGEASASAYAIARALHCRPEQVCAEIGNAINGWWLIESAAGAEGIVYRIRPVIGHKQQLPKEVGEYSSTGSTHSTPRGHVSGRVR